MKYKKTLKQTIDPIYAFNTRQSNAYRFLKMFLKFTIENPDVELTNQDLLPLMKELLANRRHFKLKQIPPMKITEDEISKVFYDLIEK